MLAPHSPAIDTHSQASYLEAQSTGRAYLLYTTYISRTLIDTNVDRKASERASRAPRHARRYCCAAICFGGKIVRHYLRTVDSLISDERSFLGNLLLVRAGSPTTRTQGRCSGCQPPVSKIWVEIHIDFVYFLVFLSDTEDRAQYRAHRSRCHNGPPGRSNMGL